VFIKDRLKDAEDRLKARVVTKFDVLRAQTDDANVRQTLIVARNTTKVRMAELNSGSMRNRMGFCNLFACVMSNYSLHF